MDCRTFHQNLEDYLEGGLDFSGRFGMERHAQQCFGCGKELTDAQQLKQMMSDLQRVKAPANFEASLLREIAAHKAHGRLWEIRKYWIYGFEWPSLRKMALASSSLAVLAFGLFYAFHRPEVARVSNPPIVAHKSSKMAAPVMEAKTNSPAQADRLLAKKVVTAGVVKSAKKDSPILPSLEPGPEDPLAAFEERDTDYVEYMLSGPDNNAVPVRLPKKIPMRYNQMSEEYFIRNVSH
jgi:hypothetical protein